MSRFLIRILPLAMAAFLAACGNSYKFGTLESRYQSPSLPIHFQSGHDDLSVSLYGSGNDQGAVIVRREYLARTNGNQTELHMSQDTGNHYPYATLQESYTLKRDPYLLGGAATWQDGWLFSGLTGSASFPHAGNYHLGAYAGCSPIFGNVASRHAEAKLTIQKEL